MKIDWWPLYEMYSVELCAIARSDYEHYRNRHSDAVKKRFPDAVCPEYRVDVTRYGDNVWAELIRNCFEQGIDLPSAMLSVRNRYASRMPWPDTLWPAIEIQLEKLKKDYTGSNEIDYLQDLTGMDSKDDRIAFINDRSRLKAFSVSEELAYRFCLGEYELINKDRAHTAAGLYGLLRECLRQSMERDLHSQLVGYLEIYCKAALV